MYQQVMFEICQSRKNFTTDHAKVFLLLVYQANVFFEARIESEGLFTVRTMVRLRIVALSVKLQIAHGCKSFFAKRASGLSILMLSAMDIVTLKGSCQKLFATQIAFQNLGFEFGIVNSLVRPHGAIAAEACTANIAYECF